MDEPIWILTGGNGFVSHHKFAYCPRCDWYLLEQVKQRWAKKRYEIFCTECGLYLWIDKQDV